MGNYPALRLMKILKSQSSPANALSHVIQQILTLPEKFRTDIFPAEAEEKGSLGGLVIPEILKGPLSPWREYLEANFPIQNIL